MRVLVACEFSGVVRESFRRKGHDAYSCDILPSRYKIAEEGRHLQCDVLPLLREKWDLVIAHPPCTYLANLGVRWFKDDPVGRRLKMIEACDFFLACLNANSDRVAVENPVMHCYARKRIGVKPSQTVQPWQFGVGETKATCLWLKGLPPLRPTEVVTGRTPRSHQIRHRHQGLLRSITCWGIAEAMAEQWG